MKLDHWQLISEGYVEEVMLGWHSKKFVLREGKSEICVWLYPNGLIGSRAYYENLILSWPASEGPAFESWHPDGFLTRRQFVFKGKLSRPVCEGFAYEVLLRDKPFTQQYWFEGKYLDALKALRICPSAQPPTDRVSDIRLGL